MISPFFVRVSHPHFSQTFSEFSPIISSQSALTVCEQPLLQLYITCRTDIHNGIEYHNPLLMLEKILTGAPAIYRATLEGSIAAWPWRKPKTSWLNHSALRGESNLMLHFLGTLSPATLPLPLRGNASRSVGRLEYANSTIASAGQGA